MLRLSKNAIGMLIAKYRTVLLHMLRKGGVALAASGLLLAAPAPVYGAEYHVGSGQVYASLEDLRTAGLSFINGDSITVHASDSSLTADFNFGAASVTLQGGSDVTLSPAPGSGIRLLSSSGSLTLAGGLVVDGFSAGAGFGGAVSGSTVSISGGTNSFTNNSANGWGGAVYGSTVDISGGANSFTNNSASGGGAVSGITVDISGGTNSFTNNSAGSSGGNGGAVYGYNTVSINGGTNSFTNNSAGIDGGAVYGYNTVISGGTNSFTHNSANGWGGAVYGYNTVSISGGTSSFTNNSAGIDGGAVYSLNDVTLRASGGDIAFHDNSANRFGGAMYVETNATLTADSGNIIFRGNTHKQGGATAHPNAIYLKNGGNDKTLTLAAKAGRSILFYDPVASNSASTNLAIAINPDAADTGVILFDQYQSELYGNTTVHNGTLQLTGGAIYGAAANTGSFTLETGSRLSADAAGGTVNAGTVSLQDGSVTTVDVSSGKLLTLNGNVTIDTGAVIDVNGYSAGSVDVVASNNTITGNFTSLKVGGVDQSPATPALDKFVNGAFLSKTNSDKTITINQGSLVWNNTDPGSAHGTFNVATDYTLAEALANNTTASAYGFNWNGATLTKTGAGTLTLSGVNTYSGGTLLNEGTLGITNGYALGSGVLTMAGGTTLSLAGSYSLANAVTLDGNATVNSDTHSSSLTGVISGSGSLSKTGDGDLTLSGDNAYTGGTVITGGTLTVNSLAALGSGSIANNNATLAFYRTGATSGQTIAFGNRYTGSGTLGIQASLTAAAQWSDLLTFDNAPATANAVYFTFTDGSNLQYLSAEGLHFAELATADGTGNTFSLAGTSLAGASQLSIKTADNQNYYLTSRFNPSLGKVYSETAAAGLGQAASLHGPETFGAIGKAAAGAAGRDTGVYAGGGRSDARHHTGSHADVQGNNFALALAWEKAKTTYGIIGQRFDGSYTTTHQASVGGTGQTIHSAGDLTQRDLGLFAEYRPDDSGRYWQGLVKGGTSKNDFRADNAQGGSRFDSERGVFGLSLGSGLVKQTGLNRSLETYQHLIYTRLGSDQVIDSIGQDIRFDPSHSLRLLTGARWRLEREGKPVLYAGAALDYEFRGKTGATINGNQADSADLQGLTGILELGFSAKQSETLSLDGTLYGYVGKKEGLAGSLTLTKRF